MINEIKNYLGAEADSLLNHQCKTVSKDLLDAATEFLRGGWAAVGPSPQGFDPTPVQDYYFRNLEREHLRRKPGLVVLHSEDPTRRVLGCLFLGDEAEVVAVTRGKPGRRFETAYRRQDTHIRRTTVLSVGSPLARRLMAEGDLLTLGRLLQVLQTQVN